MFTHKKLKKLGIIAGNGYLPQLIIEEYRKQGGEVAVVLIEGFTNPDDYKNVEFKTLGIGQVSAAIDFLKSKEVEKIIFAGGVKKPNLAALRTDKKGLILAGKLAKTKIFGDDNVLQTVINFFKSEGFEIIGVKDVLRGVLAKKGLINNVKITNKKFYNDIKLGQKALDAISQFDIGQSIIVQKNLILGIEGPEGTNALIKRCEDLNYTSERKPILIKATKKQQTNKADLPTIGLETIKNLHKAGFAGVAVESKNTILLEKEKLIKFADKYSIFVLGI